MTTPQEAPQPFWCHILSDQAGDQSAGDAWAAWLAKEIGGYAIPSKLAGRVNLRGETIPAGRLTVCVTHSGTALDGTITEEIAEKLARSLNLVVLCSPWASRSPLVDQVVRTYKMSGRSSRLLAAIISGIPHAHAEQSDQECFPAATRFNVDDEGELLTTPAEPIAADFRTADGGDGWTDPSDYLDALREADVDGDEADALADTYATRLQLMKLKIIAGVLGVSLGELTERDVAHQREMRAQQRNQTLMRLGIFGLLAVVGIWAGVLAWRSYDETQTARQRTQQNSRNAAEEAQAIELARKTAEQSRPLRLADEASKLLESGEPDARAQARIKLLEAAGLGFAPAQYQLAKLLFQDKDHVGGTGWLQKSVAQDHPAAINFLGECQRDGRYDFPRDGGKAARYFQKAANLDDGAAQANIGKLAEENVAGLGGAAAALKWYERAAANKSGVALNRLHQIYATGSNDARPDPAKAIAYLRDAVAVGNLEAQWTLGTKLLQGNGMPKDVPAGANLLRKVSAQRENPRLSEMAQIQLALLYRDGQMKVASTTDGDLTEAMRMLKVVAEKGSADACFHLAITFADSRRTVADEASSLLWYRKAADLGNAESRLFMARKLLIDLKENLILHDATRWLNAREGIPAAANPYPNLFLDHEYGYVTATKDYRDAVTWLKQARPNQRNQVSMYKVYLAELYLTEDFHSDDRFSEAFALLKEAVNMKDALAEAMLSAIYEKGHPPQVQADPAKAAEMRRTSLATGKPGPRAYFERKDRIANARRTFSDEYVKTLQSAAGRGEAKAQTELGLHYLRFERYQHTPLSLDFAKAAQQLVPGALNSDSLALMGLGLTYRQTKDLPNRFKLHLKAAQNGDEPLAHLWTGVALEQGLGTAIDLVEAYKWYLIAFKYGQDGSSAAKRRAESKMTADQQIESRRRADDYKPIKTPQTEVPVAHAKTGKEAQPTAEKMKGEPTVKKEIKPETISPELAGRSIGVLLEESERIVMSNNTSPEDLEKALQYAQAVLARSRSNTQAMYVAQRASARKGDNEASQKWLLMIANQKLSNSTNTNLNRIAMDALTFTCERGIGTPADIVEAYKWRLLALKMMNISSNADPLEKKMTPTEIEEARRRAKSFRPKGN